MVGRTALIIVDVQNDFCEGGSLAVPGAYEVVQKVNEIRKNKKFDVIVATKDYHLPNHVSFASNHQGKAAFTNITLENGKVQELWPNHCVQGTTGQDFHKELVIEPTDKIIFKGQDIKIDSYSGFGSEGENTGLNEYLKEQNIDTTYVVGLAYDFCVGSTALDSAKNGYKTFIVLDATGSISEQTVNAMNKKLDQFGDQIVKIQSNQI